MAALLYDGGVPAADPLTSVGELGTDKGFLDGEHVWLLGGGFFDYLEPVVLRCHHT
ncbi:MAG: hypothetical protein WKF82_10540 [Nocardioidaceae bacterium]